MIKNYIKDPAITPDIVYYSDIFTENTSVRILKKLESLQSEVGTGNIGNEISIKYTSDSFPRFIVKILTEVERITNTVFTTCVITTTHKSYKTRHLKSSVFFGSSKRITFDSKHGNCSKVVEVKNGSLLLERESVKKYWNVTMETSSNPFFCVTFFKESQECMLPSDLSKVYLSTTLRLELAKKIKKGLSCVRTTTDRTKCCMKKGITELSQHITLGDFIAAGDWGNVFNASVTTDGAYSRKFALKMSRLTDEDFRDPYTETSTAWYEIWILKDIIKPLLQKNICPNLPLFIDTFLCDNCSFIFRKGNKMHSSVITAIELASGDLHQYLKSENPTDDELYSALFQIMVGLHAIQLSAQILNNDIKTKNILYYNVTPGGYWHYKIGENDFYVPNYGKLFVLNDFGVSTLYDPTFQLYPTKKKKVFNLGSRFAINMNERFSPIQAETEYSTVGTLKKTEEITWYSRETGQTVEVSKGSVYKIDKKTREVIISHTLLTTVQKSYLFQHGITTNPKSLKFFQHPYVMPPFEFYNDVQDVLRMFVGGKRSTQKGNHSLYSSVSKKVQKTISAYLGVSENAKARNFSLDTYHVLAGSFLSLFFRDAKNYLNKPDGTEIGYYNMNKLL